LIYLLIYYTYDHAFDSFHKGHPILIAFFVFFRIETKEVRKKEEIKKKKRKEQTQKPSKTKQIGCDSFFVHFRPNNKTIENINKKINIKYKANLYLRSNNKTYTSKRNIK
jgi:hypothetical protein